MEKARNQLDQILKIDDPNFGTSNRIQKAVGFCDIFILLL